MNPNKQWSSRGNPVKLIDLNPSALESALLDIQKLKAGKTAIAKHENGTIKTFSSGDELGSVLRDAWLVVEVGFSSFFLSSLYSEIPSLLFFFLWGFDLGILVISNVPLL